MGFLYLLGLDFVVVVVDLLDDFPILVGDVNDRLFDKVFGVELNGSNYLVTHGIFVHDYKYETTTHQGHLQRDEEFLVPVNLTSHLLDKHLGLHLIALAFDFDVRVDFRLSQKR